jgi:hypothetical protein
MTHITAMGPTQTKSRPGRQSIIVGPEFELKLRGLRAKTNLKITISDIETITPMPASSAIPSCGVGGRWGPSAWGSQVGD